MEIDPMEIHEHASGHDHTVQKPHQSLNTLVAITIALLASFMGICKLKDDKIVQAMHVAQTDKIDSWAWYQARHIRADLATATADEMRLQAQSAPIATHTDFEKQIALYTTMAKKEQQKMDDISVQAKASKDNYERYRFRDEQFDLEDAGLTIAVAMLAITALTQKRWLYGLALAPAVFGLIMGISGLFGLHLLPHALSRFFSA